MMKKYIILFLISGFSIYAQESVKKVSFDKLIESIKGYYLVSNQRNDSTNTFSLQGNNDFKISISNNPVHFKLENFTIFNPYYNDEIDYQQRHKNYPITYSVIYNDRLISLFDNGKFVCHNLSSFVRDEEYEQKLNTKKVKQHWIIGGKLYAFSNSFFEWNNKEWIRSKTKFPIEEQPMLFEDEEFIVFRDCHGEWGGTVYFYERETGSIYYTESTCTNSVIKKDDKYIVLAHLGHMTGSSEIKSITNPRQLSKVNKKYIGKAKNGEALGYTDKSGAYKKLIDYFNVQLFSTFQYGTRQLFLTNLCDATFLAEIKDCKIQIVHPLFNDELYTHCPITRKYGDYTLINLDHYSTAYDKEISLLIIKDDKIIMVDWNENHDNN